jgi:hypothetical protein
MMTSSDGGQQAARQDLHGGAAPCETAAGSTASSSPDTREFGQGRGGSFGQGRGGSFEQGRGGSFGQGCGGSFGQGRGGRAGAGAGAERGEASTGVSSSVSTTPPVTWRRGGDRGAHAAARAKA